ncbi:MAG TPA: hypothetical protein PLP42_12270, partial [Acidobacteriota bacterium]|nr:hypothetical protein [Acidobacteriota bacterium]
RVTDTASCRLRFRRSSCTSQQADRSETQMLLALCCWRAKAADQLESVRMPVVLGAGSEPGEYGG